MQQSQFLKLFIQAVIAFSLLLNPACGSIAASNSTHPKIHTEWVSAQVEKNYDQQKVKATRVLRKESYSISIIDVTVQLKSAKQKTQAFNKPRTQHQKVPSEDDLIA